LVDQGDSQAQLSHALKLFKSSEVTLSKAAELAGLDIYDFMNVCKQERIPVIDVTREELLEEMWCIHPSISKNTF
jgi:predicted HTH domain antitoxin